jgi:hypothetical protein
MMKLRSAAGVGAIAATIAVAGVVGVGYRSAPADLPTVTVHRSPT